MSKKQATISFYMFMATALGTMAYSFTTGIFNAWFALAIIVSYIAGIVYLRKAGYLNVRKKQSEHNN